MSQITEETFLKDVAKHEMKVLLDNGLYRHLRFAATGKYSWNQWFDIITWPGRLAYTGDMGTYVFARLEDMFEFFRTRPGDGKNELYINTGYWAEKLEAVDRCGGESGYEAFSPEKMKEHVKELVEEWIEEDSLTVNQQRQLRNAIKDSVLNYLEDGEHDARRALDAFEYEIDGHAYRFQDTWEWRCQEYTVRFVWCCYALAWGIKQYDSLKVEATEPEVTA